MFDVFGIETAETSARHGLTAMLDWEFEFLLV